MNTSESDYVDCVCVFLVTKCGSKCLSHRSRSSRLFVYLHVFAFLLRSHKFNYLLIKLYISNLWRIDASLTTSKIEFRRIFNEFKTAKKTYSILQTGDTVSNEIDEQATYCDITQL